MRIFFNKKRNKYKEGFLTKDEIEILEDQPVKIDSSDVEEVLGKEYNPIDEGIHPV